MPKIKLAIFISVSFLTLFFLEQVIAKPTTGRGASSPILMLLLDEPGYQDTSAPTMPTGLSVTPVSSSEINLSWNASTDDVGVSGYKVYRGGTFLKQVSETSMSDSGLQPSTEYCYTISAYDAAGNESEQSSQECATTLTDIQDYTFGGGSINDLRSVSPTLEFGDLTIAGKLSIPEAESNAILSVRNLYLNSMIEVAHPTCKPFSSAPNLTINASGEVKIDAVIDLVGHSGDSLAAPPEQTLCNDCYGKDGGNLTVNAANIYVNKRIDTSGGWAGSYVWGNTGYPFYQLIRMGCSGGDGGNITLNASGILNIGPGGADLDLEGGQGGTGTPYNGGADGTDGNDGVLSWSGATITVAEDPGGTTGELNMYYYNAQWLDYKRMTLTGIVGKGEEAAHRGNTGTFAVTFPNGFVDYIEDFFCLYLKQFSTIKLALSPANSNADLDLYLINGTLTNIIAESNGASGSESITSPILSPGKYYVGVSYADDGLNIVNVNYTLRFNQ